MQHQLTASFLLLNSLLLYKAKALLLPEIQMLLAAQSEEAMQPETPSAPEAILPNHLELQLEPEEPPTGGGTEIVIRLPLTHVTVIGGVLVSLLVVSGAVFLSKLTRIKHCNCPLCAGQYQITDEIGQTDNNAVYLAEKNKQKLALKKIGVEDVTLGEMYAAEAKQLRSLKHKNVVQYIDDFIHADYSAIDTRYSFFIAMEYCPGGDLCDKIEAIRDRGSHFTEKQILNTLAAVCRGLRYTHTHGLIHRDIKSQNIFLDEAGRVKLGDFGLAEAFQRGGFDTSSVGTECYMAPEVRDGKGLHGAGKSADVWSLGCVLLELMTLTFAWEYEFNIAEEVTRDRQCVAKLLKDSRYSSKLGVLAKRMLSAEPSARPSVEEILKKKLLKPYVGRDWRKGSD